MKKANVLSEQQLLNQLDIPDWRHMSKDKIISFASNMQFLGPEVAKKAIEQFPEFRAMSSDIVSLLKDSLNQVSTEGSKSLEKAYEINNKILDNLNARLSKPLLLPSERRKIIDAMLEVSKNVNELDKSHKGFLLHGMKTVGAAAVGIAVLGAAILGVNIKKD